MKDFLIISTQTCPKTLIVLQMFFCFSVLCFLGGSEFQVMIMYVQMKMENWMIKSCLNFYNNIVIFWITDITTLIRTVMVFEIQNV